MRVFSTVFAASLALSSATSYSQSQTRPQTRAASAARSTITVTVTDRTGKPLSEVQVTMTGPVDRSGETGTDGIVAFQGMPSGAYRLRYDREGSISLEREVTVVGGKPLNVTSALTDAPPPPPPPKPEPAPPPPAAPPP